MSGRGEPGWQGPREVHLARVDVPFLELTWFFVKASMAMAVAFVLTSWIWALIVGAFSILATAVLLATGAPVLRPSPPGVPAPAAVLPAPLPPPEPPRPVELPPPPPPPEPEAVAPSPARSAADAAATEAAQRAELERLRRERQR